MKFPDSLYEIGDCVVVDPPWGYLEAHSVFTIVGIMLEKKDADAQPEVLYAMKETRWMIKEHNIRKKVKL
jgi:hypothetical protein